MSAGDEGETGKRGGHGWLILVRVQRNEAAMKRHATLMQRHATFRETVCYTVFAGFSWFFDWMQHLKRDFLPLPGQTAAGRPEMAGRAGRHGADSGGCSAGTMELNDIRGEVRTV
jgi:hypothetical protein